MGIKSIDKSSLNCLGLKMMKQGVSGILRDITVEKITEILGLEPNIDYRPAAPGNSYVKSWGFKCDMYEIGIWDFKGSYEYLANHCINVNEFSFYGDKCLMKRLFEKYIKVV